MNKAAVKPANHKMDYMNAGKVMGHAYMDVKMAIGMKLALNTAQKDVLINFAMRQMEYVYTVAHPNTMGSFVFHSVVSIASMFRIQNEVVM